MANEVEYLQNPTSIPAAVSTGYQRQNTNIVSQRAGIDRSYVEGGVGQVTVYISGPIDVNGVLYTVKSNTVLTPTGTGRWFIYLDESGGEPQYLTPTLVQNDGTWDASKNARYYSGYRMLNWIIDYDGTDCIVERWITPETNDQNKLHSLDEPEVRYYTSSTTWVVERSKYYSIEISAAGGDGGDAIISSSPVSTRGGPGGRGLAGFGRFYAEAGDSYTVSITSTSGGYTGITNGVTTVQCQNGFDGEDGLNGAGGATGADGALSTNIDFTSVGVVYNPYGAFGSGAIRSSGEGSGTTSGESGTTGVIIITG